MCGDKSQTADFKDGALSQQYNRFMILEYAKLN